MTEEQPVAADPLEPEFWKIEEGHKKFIAATVNGKEVRVRIPLQVWNAPTEANLLEYTKELKKKVMRCL